MEMNALQKSTSQPGRTHFSEDFDHEPLMNNGRTNNVKGIATRITEVGNLPERADTSHTPIWIRRRVLSLFFILFTLCWVSLIIVWKISIVENGFSLTVTQNRLAWKYGPTAVLVIILSLWRKVDYHCKWTQPWVNLSKGHQTASRTVLLDYLEPLDEVTLFRALRDGDYRVSFVIFCARLLQLAVVLSTTLLTATRTELQATAPITYNTTFDSSAYWSARNSGSNANASLIPPVFSAGGILSDAPVNAYLGTITQNSYPLGSDKGIAYQTFGDMLNPDVYQITAPVDVFVPRIGCQVAKIEHVPLSTIPEAAQEDSDELVAFLIYTPDCPVSPDQSRSNSTAFSASLWARSSCSSTESTEFLPVQSCWIIGTGSSAVDCGHPQFLGDGSQNPVMKRDDSSSNNTRMLYWVANTTTTPISPDNINTNYTYGLSQTAAFLCDVDYSVQRMDLEQDSKSGLYARPNVSNDTSVRYLEEFTRYQLFSVVDASIETAGGFAPVLTRAQNASALNQIVFEDADKMSESLVDLMSGTAAQFMRQYMLLPGNSRGEATVTMQGDRLQVNIITLWTMAACLILCSIAAFAMVALGKKTFIPSGNPTLAQSACLLAASPKFASLLDGCGHMTSKELAQVFQDPSLKISASPNPSLQVSWESKQQQNKVDTYQDFGARNTTVVPSLESWKPLASQRWVVGLSFALPIAFIIVIEVLYQESVRKHGLVTLSPGTLGSTFVTLVPIFVLVLIATLFQSYDFLSALLAPFNQMNSTKDGLFLNLLGRYPLTPLWTSLKHRHFGSWCAKVAALLGGLLTIVGSDLLVFEIVTSTNTAFTASQATSWKTQWQGSGSTDNGAAETFDQIRLGTIPIPPQIWEAYVLPELENFNLPAAPVGSEDLQQNYTLTLPALKPRLECDLVPQNAISTSFFSYGSFADRMNITVQTQVPEYCSDDGLVNWTTKWIGTDYEGYMGLMYNLYMGPGQNDSNNVNSSDLEPGYQQTMFNATMASDNPTGCPSLAITFGHLSPYENTNSTDLSKITALLCHQKLGENTVAVTLQPRDNATDLHMSLHTPPTLVNEQTKWLTNGTDKFDSFSYRLQDHLNALDSADVDPSSIRNYGDPIDRIFRRLINDTSSYYVDPQILVGADNSAALISAVQGIYTKYMVNAIDRNLRATPSTPITLDGSVESETSRLMVGQLSKLLVQILLAVMIVFGGLSHFLSRVRGVLPRSPCSIASSMAFFAGSRLCTQDHMPPNPHLMSEEALKSALGSRKYGFGWWNKLGSEVQSEVDDVDMQALSTTYWRFGVDLGTPKISGFQPRGNRAFLSQRAKRYRLLAT